MQRVKAFAEKVFNVGLKFDSKSQLIITIINI